MLRGKKKHLEMKTFTGQDRQSLPTFYYCSQTDDLKIMDAFYMTTYLLQPFLQL